MLKAQGFTEIQKKQQTTNNRQPTTDTPKKRAGYHKFVAENKKTSFQNPSSPVIGRRSSVDTLEWQAPAYEFRKKSTDWYWALGIITIAIFTASFFAKNYLFGVFSLLAGFSIALYSTRRPETVTFKISERGIKIDNVIYDYENLKHFWINYNPPVKKELLVESSKTFIPYITIPLGDTDPAQIRETLLPFLKEKKIDEPLVSVIANLLGI